MYLNIVSLNEFIFDMTLKSNVFQMAPGVVRFFEQNSIETSLRNKHEAAEMENVYNTDHQTLF